MALMLATFTDQAHNLILLSEDEARMLGRPVVAPEHVLLALTRRGNVRRLLADRGVTGSDVYQAIVRSSPVGDDLVLGPVPRSAQTDALLERAVDVAAQRGVLGPSSEHLLLALAENDRAASLLNDVGIDNVDAMVDGMPGERRPAVSDDLLRSYLLRVAARSTAPRPGPAPPVFERYSAEAQRAVRAAVEVASLLERPEVEPVHLLLGCLHVPEGLAARVLETELAPSEMGTLGEAMERAMMYGGPPAHQSTGIFTDAARRILAQDALAYAYRHDHPWIGTGHLLLAALGAEDRAIDRIVGSGLMGSGPVHGRLARSLTRALPGDEQATGRVRRDGAIAFDLLIRDLTTWFRDQLPPEWVIHGSGRSGGMRLKVPSSRSEEDFAVDMSGIVLSDRPGPERLLTVTRDALAGVQGAVVTTTASPWPGQTSAAVPPEPRAEIAGDAVNPRLRLCYGPSEAPVAEVTPPILLDTVLDESGAGA
ncbi:MAG TPA: Clp protease N-terminal domain-containing protein [Solirubrobacteraceae bacterium]|jgi:hypothetical protein